MMTVMMKLTDNNFKRKVTLRASVGIGGKYNRIKKLAERRAFFCDKSEEVRTDRFCHEKKSRN